MVGDRTPVRQQAGDYRASPSTPSGDESIRRAPGDPLQPPFFHTCLSPFGPSVLMHQRMSRFPVRRAGSTLRRRRCGHAADRWQQQRRGRKSTLASGRKCRGKPRSLASGDPPHLPPMPLHKPPMPRSLAERGLPSTPLLLLVDRSTWKTSPPRSIRPWESTGKPRWKQRRRAGRSITSSRSRRSASSPTKKFPSCSCRTGNPAGQSSRSGEVQPQFA